MKMKDYSSYGVQDFIMDKAFQQKVKAPSSEGDAYWKEVEQLYPHKMEAMDEAAAFIRSLNFSEQPLQQSDHSKIWDSIDQNTAPKGGFIYTYRSLYSKPQSFRYWRYAAGILLPLIGIMLYWMMFTSSPTTYVTSAGEQQLITLPDSSTVKLNAHSQLSFSTDWEMQTTREVWLEGEAFFEVKGQMKVIEGERDRKVKFIVHTPQVDVEVVGTSFNVKYRKQETEVVLSEGKIHLSSQDSTLEMYPGEMVKVREHIIRKKKEVNTKVFSAWTNQEFIFEDTPLSKIIHLLEENYGFQVHTKFNNTDQRISATSPVSTSDLTVFLKKVEMLYAVQIRQDGKDIYISKK